MKTYNYFYGKTPISKQHFLNFVPSNWESEVVDGEYHWGSYKAIEIEDLNY